MGTWLLREAALHVAPGKACIDVGPGIRPQTLAKFDTHICIEPHIEYVRWLRENGYRTIKGVATECLPKCEPVDVVFLLDVIEHMDRADGYAAIDEAQRLGQQVIVFTPMGFLAQTDDCWGMNGAHWQTHRSGWTPDDFADWKVIVDKRAHKGHGAFIAIWNRA